MIFSLTVQRNQFPREKMLVARGFTQGSFVILWMVIYQLSDCFKRVRVIMFSLCTFPIMVAQICLNSCESSCLPSLAFTMRREVAVLLWLHSVGDLSGSVLSGVSCTGRTGRTHTFLLQARYAQQIEWDSPRWKGLILVFTWENVLLGLSIKDTHINIYIKMPRFHQSFPHHTLGHHS